MSLTYVIPDIHGRADLLDEAVLRIEARARGERGTLILLGDYVNKGPDSRGVIEWLLHGAIDGWPMVALKGNHDAIMVEALRDPAKTSDWFAKGGDAALASYCGKPGCEIWLVLFGSPGAPG